MERVAQKITMSGTKEWKKIIWNININIKYDKISKIKATRLIYFSDQLYWVILDGFVFNVLAFVGNELL